MTPPSPRRRALAGAAAAAVCVGLALTGASAKAAPAPAAAPDASAAAEGPLMSYVVNTRVTKGQVRVAEKAITDAGGTVVQSWPQIGVVVAHSTSTTFREDVRSGGPGRAVQSVGATRTAPVAEGTPGADDAQAPSVRGFSALGQAGASLFEQRQGVVTEAADVPDPLEAGPVRHETRQGRPRGRRQRAGARRRPR